jgi:hypothetical protein
MAKVKRRQFIHGIAAGAADGLMGSLHQALAADRKSLPQGIVELRGEVLESSEW